MSNHDILKKSIRKAVDNGYKGIINKMPNGSLWCYPEGIQLLEWDWEDEDRIFTDGKYEDRETINVEAIIFSHDFAKSLWPSTQTAMCPYCGVLFMIGYQHPKPCPFSANIAIEPWKYHLQLMVISDDPIKYLGDHIDEKT